MDSQSFDRITRNLANGASRRRAITAGVGALVAVLGLQSAPDAAARRVVRGGACRGKRCSRGETCTLRGCVSTWITEVCIANSTCHTNCDCPSAHICAEGFCCPTPVTSASTGSAPRSGPGTASACTTSCDCRSSHYCFDGECIPMTPY